MKGELEGRVVLVTGSGSGLGAAVASAAARAGARTVLNCRQDERRAEALCAELARGGAEVRAVKADATDPEGARTLVEAAHKAFGQVDVLVNTVGAFEWKTVAEMEPAEWRAVLSSNLDSVFLVSRLVLPGMRERRFGRIVNFAEVGAERTAAHPRVAAWAAAKAGVVAFSKALALEEARCGITVNVACPGVIDDEGKPGRRSALAGNGGSRDRVPVGRAAHSDDVVRAVLFFASPAADFVTGQVLAVAGGAFL